MSQRQVKQMPLHGCCAGSPTLYQALELLLTTRITQAHGTEGEDGERVGRVGSLFPVVAVPLRGHIWDTCYQMPSSGSTGTGKRPTMVPLTLLPTGLLSQRL